MNPSRKRRSGGEDFLARLCRRWESAAGGRRARDMPLFEGFDL